LVHQLKKDFPQLCISINGGINSSDQVARELQHLDGVMVGREAYHNPWWLASWDAAFFGDAHSRASITRESVEAQLVAYMQREFETRGTPWPSVARHMLGLRHGQSGARLWRQVWSNHRLKALSPLEVSQMASAHRQALEAA
jgi:tRNA-dihydrouridine synthase A